MKRNQVKLVPEKEIKSIAADLRCAKTFETFFSVCMRISKKLACFQFDIMSIGTAKEIEQFYQFENLVARVKEKIYHEKFVNKGKKEVN